MHAMATSAPPGSELRLAGELVLAGDEVGNLALAGDLVHVVRGGVLTLAEAAVPQIVGRCVVGAGSGRVAAVPGRALVGLDRSIAVIDTADPRAPVVRGDFVVGPRVSGIAVGPMGDDGLVLVSDGEALTCWRLGDGGQATRLGGVELELARQITVMGSLALVSADSNGLIIVDVADPSRPRVCGRFTGPGDVCGVAVAGGRAYVADYTGGVSVVDLTDPRRPRSIGAWDEGMVGEVAVAGDVAYVAMGTLTVLDVSDGRRPRRLATHTVAPDLDTAWAVAVDGHGRVIALGERGLTVWSAV